MAVLAVKPQGQRSANQYPSMISQIIKVARFIIIQMAYQQMDQDQEYAEDREPDLLSLVTQMVDNCRVQGSQGAIQWIFDRRVREGFFPGFHSINYGTIPPKKALGVID